MNEGFCRLSAHTSAEDRVRYTKPDWLIVEAWIRRVYLSGGAVSLEFGESDQVPDILKLSMRADPEKYLLIAANFRASEKEVVRWWTPGKSSVPEMVAIGGNEWDARSVVTDIEVALHVFKEFFETKDLSAETLRGMS